MKKNITTLTGILFLFTILTSCSFSTPAELGRKRALEWKEALESGDADKMEKAWNKYEKGFEKYAKDRDAYFEYMDAFNEIDNKR